MEECCNEQAHHGDKTTSQAVLREYSGGRVVVETPYGQLLVQERTIRPLSAHGASNTHPTEHETQNKPQGETSGANEPLARTELIKLPTKTKVLLPPSKNVGTNITHG